MLYNHHTLQGKIVLVTANTKDRVPVFRYESHAREAIETLYRAQVLHPFLLYGFVIMPDHCHLLMKTIAKENLSMIMKSFKGGTAHNIGKGPIWQSRFDAKVMHAPEKALEYIHQNPVKAGLTRSAELYPWSSASGKWKVSELGPACA